MRAISKVIVISFICATAACGDDSDDGNVNPDVCAITPGDWSAPEFDANAGEALALRAQLDALVGLMREAEQEVATVDEVSDLTALYQAGDPSLSAIVSAGYSPVIDDAFADFVALAIAGVQDLVDDDGTWTPGASGGIFGGAGARGLNTGGLEVRQIVDKGLFGGAALYNQALGLTKGEITQETIDALAALYGADAALDPAAVTDSANYSFQMGFHAEISSTLTAARAYAADGVLCRGLRDVSIELFFRAWEQALVARTVFYANAASAGLTAATTDDERADALHELAEGIGLMLGFYKLPNPTTGPLKEAGRILTDADIEAFMTAIGVDIADLSASTTGAFVADPAGFATAVGTAEQVVVDAYGLSPAELESYRTPTEG